MPKIVAKKSIFVNAKIVLLILPILKNKYLCIFEDSFEAKLLGGDCALRVLSQSESKPQSKFKYF